MHSPLAFTLRGALAVLAATHIGSPAAQNALIHQQIPQLLAQYSEHGALRLPDLSPADLETIKSGSPLLMLHGDPAAAPGDKVRAMRVVGWHLVKAPRLLVWLSLFMSRDDSSARLQHVVLTRLAAGSHVSYHHIDLPWPVKDRHWVLLSEKDVNLASQSRDDIWEHRWSLLPLDDNQLEAAYDTGAVPGLTRKVFDDSVYLVANRGAWIVFDLGAEGTLVAASMDIDLGGRFPDALVQSFAKRQMKEFFDSLAVLRGAHYAATPAIEDGRGVPITQEAARRAARYWAEGPVHAGSGWPARSAAPSASTIEIALNAIK